MKSTESNLANEREEPSAREQRDRQEDQELILWSLSLSPEARLEVLQDFVDAFWTPAHG